MENAKVYVVAEVGFEALFEAMVTLAEADIKSKNENEKQDAMQGLQEWLKVLRTLDIADAIIK